MVFLLWNLSQQFTFSVTFIFYLPIGWKYKNVQQKQTVNLMLLLGYEFKILLKHFILEGYYANSDNKSKNILK